MRLAAETRLRRSIPACAGEPLKIGDTITIAKVYPRVCGGTRRMALCPPLGAGLSPRVRGNPSGGLARHPAAGSIPACAGEPI